jgi:hypothetical protein
MMLDSAELSMPASGQHPLKPGGNSKREILASRHAAIQGCMEGGASLGRYGDSPTLHGR